MRGFLARTGASLVDSGRAVGSCNGAKAVTVVFSDVTGSTALGERLDPEALRRLLTRYFEEMKTLLESHGGTVREFLGDAVMAVFGTPQAHEDDALRAVRAAEEMRRCLESLNDEFERDWGIRIAARTGVNTGEVVAGDPAASQTLVLGDAVNVAARLEQAAEPGEILLGEETYRLVRDAVRAEPLEPLALKGKAEGVSAFRLLEVLPEPYGVARRFDTPLVGRQRELARLRQTFEQAVNEHAPKLVTILGPPGIGKSRLALELASSLEDRATVLRGRCLPYGEGITFWPLAEIVRGLDLDETLAGVEDAARIASHIRGAAGLAKAGGTIEETFWAVRKLLEALARKQPVVALFEDIHWAEPTFLDLLEYLAAWTREAPLVILCLARPELLELRPAWGGAQISLEPLSNDQAQTRSSTASSAQARFLRPSERRSRRSPKGIHSSSSRSSLSRSTTSAPSSPYRRRSTPSLSPGSTASSRRNALFSSAPRSGKVFYWSAVSRLCPEELRPRVAGHLFALVRKDLVVPETSELPGEDAFRFRHILIREAAYDAIPKERRAELHERVADWLESKDNEQDEIVGYHLEQAYQLRADLGPIGEPEQGLAQLAGRRLASAGQRAFRRGDMSAAASLLERAAALLPRRDPERAELLPELGLAQFAVGQLEQAEVALGEAIEDARASGDRRTEWRSIIGRSRVRMSTEGGRRALDEVASEVEQAIGVFGDLGDELGLARAWSLLTEVRMMRGQVGAAREAAERTAEHARSAGSHGDEALAAPTLAYLMIFGPTPVAHELRRCETLLERLQGNRVAEAMILNSLAVLAAMEGRFDEAAPYRAQAEAIVEDLGVDRHTALTAYLRGWGEFFAGNLGAAERDMHTALELFRAIGDEWWLASVGVDLPQVLYEEGRYDEAFELTEVLGKVPLPHDLEWQSCWRGIRAKVLARRDRLPEAVRLARQALALIEQTDLLTTHAIVLTDLAEVLRLGGNPEEAAAAFVEAIELYERKGNLVSAAKARALLAELATARTG